MMTRPDGRGLGPDSNRSKHLRFQLPDAENTIHSYDTNAKSSPWLALLFRSPGLCPPSLPHPAPLMTEATGRGKAVLPCSGRIQRWEDSSCTCMQAMKRERECGWERCREGQAWKRPRSGDSGYARQQDELQDILQEPVLDLCELLRPGQCKQVSCSEFVASCLEVASGLFDLVPGVEGPGVKPLTFLPAPAKALLALVAVPPEPNEPSPEDKYAFRDGASTSCFARGRAVGIPGLGRGFKRGIRHRGGKVRVRLLEPGDPTRVRLGPGVAGNETGGVTCRARGATKVSPT